ncbi:MAG TPA: YrhB domain-containing protein [Niastella sp.]
MITKDQAINIASTYVREIPVISKHTLLLQLEKTIEFELGWVFYYQTKAYIENGNYLDAAVGNAPIIIDKRTGKVHVTGTAYSVKKYIEDYLKDDLIKPKR